MKLWLKEIDQIDCSDWSVQSRKIWWSFFSSAFFKYVRQIAMYPLEVMKIV